MRRRAFVFLFTSATALSAACGLEVVGTFSSSTSPGDGGTDPNLPPRTDGSTEVIEDAATDAGDDGEALRPDAGTLFVPSHVGATSYVLDAPDFVVPAASTFAVDTTNATIQTDANLPTPSPHLKIDGNVAVLSAGAFEVGGTLEVRGSRALAIVAAKGAVVSGVIDARAVGIVPGPGGAASGAVAIGAGGNGSGGATEAGGGGGGGHGSAGASGGGTNAINRGLAGAPVNANGALLVGGGPGGSGARVPAEADCTDRSRGGGGGGAIQISAIGAIGLTAAAKIYLGGGGGRGGCRGNMPMRTGGGGGGAGGLLFLESVGGIVVAGTVDARGGGGGEGGGLSIDGNDGTSAEPPTLLPASGGIGGGVGGSGGLGGTATAAPTVGAAAVSSGGGGGGIGRAFFRTRAPAVVDVTGALHAVRIDGAF